MPTIDVTQMKRKLEKPEVRVWFHPKNGSDDYWHVYPDIVSAKIAIEENNENKKSEARAEMHPLIAYKGKEYSVSEFRKKAKSKLRSIL